MSETYKERVNRWRIMRHDESAGSGTRRVLPGRMESTPTSCWSLIWSFEDRGQGGR